MSQKSANNSLQRLASTISSNQIFLQSEFLLFTSSAPLLLHLLILHLLLLLVSTEESCFSGIHGILNNLLSEKDGAVFFLFALTCTDSHGLAHTDSHTHKATEVVLD